MAEQSARVAQRCEEAKETGHLMLDGCDLRKFPDGILLLVRGVELQTVTLAHNALQRIPPKLGAKFSSITSLDLSHNRFSSLPDELSHMERLTVLNLSHNLFQALPPVLRALPSLQQVDLSHNRLELVHSGDLDSMQSLESVDLRSNPLDSDVKAVLQSIVRIRVLVDDL